MNILTAKTFHNRITGRWEWIHPRLPTPGTGWSSCASHRCSRSSTNRRHN